MNYTEMINGRWYVVNNGEDWLMKFDRIENKKIYDYKTIVIRTNRYYKKGAWGGIIQVRTIREATDYEILQYYPDEVLSIDYEIY